MRSEHLLALRSEIKLDIERNSLELEQFQNQCLRPILKFQNDALLAVFKSQTIEIPKSAKERENFVRHRLQKDTITRNILIGMILGQMTLEELAFYSLNKNELSRRIVTLLTQRILGNL